MANINAYGMGGSPLINIFPPPIVANREPRTSDKEEIGQTWIYPAEDNCWVLTSMFNGDAIWTLQTQTGGGAGVFTNLTATGTINLDNVLTTVDSTYAVHAAGQNINITSDLGKISIVGGEGVADAVNITAGDPNGGIDIDSLLGGVTIDTTGDIAINTAGAGTIQMVSNTTSLISAVGQLTLGSDATALLTSTAATTDSIKLEATDDDGGILITSGTGGTNINTSGPLLISTDFDMDNSIIIQATDDIGGIDILSGSGGIDCQANVGSISFTAGADEVDAIHLDATHANGGIDIDSLLGGITIDTTAAISIEGVTNSDFTVTGASQDLNLISSAGSINVNASEGVANAITINASHNDGGVQITSGTNGATILSGGGVVTLTSNLASSAAIFLDSSDATGGVTVTSGAVAATTGLQLNQGAVTLAVQVGAGAPGHDAPQGSLYLRSDGTGVNDRLYVKTVAANTWTAIVTVA